MKNEVSTLRTTVRFGTARRALLASVAALASVGLSKVMAPQEAQAANGDNLILGQANSATSTTVLLKSGSGTGFQVRNTGTGLGIDARSTDSYALYGESGTGHGVIGVSNGLNEGVLGISANGIALRGDSANSNAVMGTTTNGVGGLFGASSATGYAIRATGRVLIDGDFSATGMKSAVVPGSDGELRRVFCLESTESYFEDFGRDRIVNGRGVVRLDPEFRAIVRGQNYEIFLTPLGDCKGLYVSSSERDSFEVRELQGGTSTVSFTYRVAIKRKDIPEGRRLQRVERPKDTVKIRDVQTILREGGVRK